MFSGHFILIEGVVITGGFPGSILIGIIFFFGSHTWWRPRVLLHSPEIEMNEDFLCRLILIDNPYNLHVSRTLRAYERIRIPGFFY